MPRQSISFTPPNDAWLKAQVKSKEFASKSEVVNDLIRKAREIEASEDPKVFDRLFSKIAPPKRPKSDMKTAKNVRKLKGQD